MKNLENKMSEENSKKSSTLQIVALILTALLIVGLILVNFVCSENRFVITGSIVTLVCLLIVVVLSKSFDSFSIVGIFNLRREVKENKEKIDKLEKLMFQSVNNIQALQSSHNTNYFVNNPAGLEVQRMDSADKEKIKEEERQQQEEEEKRENSRTPRQRLNREIFDELLLKKYREKHQPAGNILYDMKISDKDFISDRPVMFKAYIKDDGKELFIDTLQAGAISFLMYYDRIYVKISKILNYRGVKNTNAKMVCLVGKLDSEEKAGDSKLESYFLPAISNNLLDIVPISYTQAEYESCLIPKS